MKKILISLVLVLGMLMVPAAAVAQNMYADVNGDLEVNIADINAVIGVILSDVSNPSADVNGDGEVNIADINAVIDIILNGGFDPHLLEVCEKVVEIDHVIVGYYKQCESLDELMDHADDIRALDGVEEVYSDGHSVMFVRIKDFRTILYSFYDEPDEDDNAVFQMEQQMNHLIQAVPHHQNGTTAYTYSDIRDAKFLAVNQQTGFSYSTQSAGTTCSLFRELGFQAEVVSAPNVEFFRDGIFDCDYLFLIAHGAYDFNQNIHWIATSESVQRDANGDLDPNFVIRYANYSETELTFDYSVVCVSEHFINSSPRSFRHPGKGIVFNVACHSVQGPKTEATDTTDYSLAEVFITKGAGAYIGYDESNWGGQLAGLQFFSGMLSGMSVGRSFDFLSFPLKHEYHKKDNPRFWADLKKYPEQDNIYNECINRPIITLEDKSDDNHLQIDLCADNLYMTYFAPTGYQSWNIVNDMNGLKSLPYDYGFELSESEQFTNIISLDEKHIGEDGLGLTYLHYIYSLTYDGSQTDSKIMPNTTYWVRAYVYDGQGYNYSEPITFTTGSIEDNFPQTETFTVNGVSFKMVAVEGGTFMMGATAEQVDDAESNEYPVHQVTLSSYSIGQTEVTQALWQAVMGSNPSYFTGDLNRPVEEVSWNDCQTFITKLNQMTGKNFRLPTEAEWEYAARGGNRSKGYKYSGSNDIGSVAWYEENADNVSDRGTRPVATKAPNELGLYDMSGNVWEWCQDWFDNDYGSNSPTENPTGPESGYNRVFRGGSWGYNAAFCRVSRRGSYIPTYHWRSGGLRLVMSGELEPESERDVLIKLFMDTNGSFWTRNDNWCSDKPLSIWYGLSLSGENVRKIDLRNNNLSGNVEIKGFKSLYNLLLTGNNLSSVSIDSCPSLDLGYGFNGLNGIVLDELNISNCFSGYGQHFLSNVNITSINFSDMTALGRMFFDVITSNEITLNNCQFEGQGLLIEDNSNVGSLTVDHCVIPSGLLGGNVDDLIIRDSNIGDWWVIGARSSITIINSYIDGHLVNISGTPEEVDSYIRGL